MSETLLWQIAFGVVITCWLLFIVVFFGRKRPPGAKEQKRVSTSFGAVALQGLGFAAAWNLRRPWFTPIFPAAMPVQVVMALIAIGLAALTVWLVSASVRTLGKQWTIVARVVEGHQLITSGPYRIVRHPIYCGMFMIMLATALVISHWLGLVIAVVLYTIGAVWRIAIEEKLLIETFGNQYLEYKRKVPAFIPWKLSTQ
ncbi:MAG TPA: isoprenylcysteine carboxylmethyltransferase family protein [Candidatus Krumholzibacteria bacterium]|nr:isoprenylcysteine carboxylmethyltransferase family protein [Candidatus Krumholzibacteria bacterium]